MISYIPEADREHYKRLQKQGRLPRNTRISGNYLVNDGITEEDICDGKELKWGPHGEYLGFR